MMFWAKLENVKVNRDRMNRVFMVFMILIAFALTGRNDKLFVNTQGVALG